MADLVDRQHMQDVASEQHAPCLDVQRAAGRWQGSTGEPRLRGSPPVATGNPLGDQPSPRTARQSSKEDKRKHLASVEKNLRRVFAPPSRLLRAARDWLAVIAS